MMNIHPFWRSEISRGGGGEGEFRQDALAPAPYTWVLKRSDKHNRIYKRI